jgi:hypothetical protein
MTPPLQRDRSVADYPGTTLAIATFAITGETDTARPLSVPWIAV